MSLIFKDGIAFNSAGFLLFNSNKLEESVAWFNSHHWDKAIFSSYGGREGAFEERDLQVLNWISAKELIIIMDGVLDCSAVNSQHELTRLEITSDPVNHVLDFSNFPKLEKFKGYYTKKLVNLFSCEHLRSLTLWKYQSKTGDISEFSGLKNVEELAIIQSNVKTLEGIDKLSHLKGLTLGYNRSLEDFNAKKASLPLLELEIEMCKKLDLLSLHGLDSLKKLVLSKLDKIKTLSPVLDILPSLEFISFVEFDLEDGDLGYLLHQPRLKTASFVDKRRYNLTADQVEAKLQEKWI